MIQVDYSIDERVRNMLRINRDEITGIEARKVHTESPSFIYRSFGVPLYKIPGFFEI